MNLDHVRNHIRLRSADFSPLFTKLRTEVRIPEGQRFHYGITVGGVGERVGVPVGVGVNVGVGDKRGVGVLYGVRVGRLVGVSVNVEVGVSVGGKTCVGVTSASDGYNSRIAPYQSKPLVNANSVKRAPA